MKVQPRPQGFTLLELLVVLVIIGITLGAVSLNALPSRQQVLQNDAQRIALLLQSARDEAILRNRPVAFVAYPDHYDFQLFEDNRWQPLQQDTMLRERAFTHPPVQLTLDPATFGQGEPLRIIFGREPVASPFKLSLSSGDEHAAIRADGVGHFSVE